MKKTRNMLILLLLLIIIPFNIYAEEEDGLGNPSAPAPDTEAIYGNSFDVQMPIVDEVIIPDDGELIEAIQDTDLVVDDENSESVDSLLPESANLSKNVSTEVEGVELVSAPGSVGVWIYLVVVFTLLACVFFIFCFIFYKIFAAYSSVLERNDDNAENIITIR